MTGQLPKKSPNWVKKAHRALLGELRRLNPGFEVAVYCYEDLGLRVSEVSFTRGRGTSSYQRSCSEAAAVILECEEFMLTHRVKPVRPGGWTSDLDVHQDSKDRLSAVVSSEA